jgi:beta-galactosidase
VEPAFTWDPPELSDARRFLGTTPRAPERSAFIATNCDRVEVYLGERHVGTAIPDRNQYPNLPYPPALIGLDLAADQFRDLTLNGYLGDDLVLTRQFAGDRAQDTLALVADDESIAADGIDATRVVIAVADRFGEHRGASNAVVDVTVEGPGLLVGDNRIDFSQTGAAAAVWIRSVRGRPGQVLVRASALRMGTATALVNTVQL